MEKELKTSIGFWTIPNIICLIRTLGSVGLIGLAIGNRPYWFVAVYVMLGVSDLVDGPIARFLNQNNAIGASMDSLADIALSSSLVIGATILRWDTIQGELWLIAMSSAVYLVAAGYCFWRFRRLPFFHTYSAKVTHLLVAIAGISLILQWSIWPLRLAALAAFVTNLEILAICRKLVYWRSDVPSYFVMHRTGEMTGASELELDTFHSAD